MTLRYSLLISPRAAAAYFAQTTKLCRAELATVVPPETIEDRQIGDMRFLSIPAQTADIPLLMRLSFVQGVFEEQDGLLKPLDQGSDFLLHSDFVWGEKYKGKTNETLTQLMINLGLHHIGGLRPGLRLLDPMCGRGTTLFWAMRYGMGAVGVEQDSGVLAEIRRGLKKWTKLHRVKHKLSEGWVQKTNKAGTGKYLDFAAAGHVARIVIGDSSASYDLLTRKTVDIIATDIPYGVQHMGGKSSRSPLETLQACAPVWERCLRPGGAMVISFNANIPKKDALLAAFSNGALKPVHTDLSHQMSESILRDVVVLKKAEQ